MVGLTIVVIALSIALLVLVALFLRQRRRIRKLAEQAEDFLVGNGAPLEFSVQEDSLAPLHNAIAELQNRLLLAKERQAEECRRTSDLTADISHQLKTPLAALNIYNGLLHEEDIEASSVKEFADLSEQELDRMETLVQSLLKITRLDAGSVTLEKGAENVADMLRDVELHFAYRAKQEHKELVLSGPEEVLLFCDRDWLTEAIDNIVKNALDHTESGDAVHITWKALPNAVQIAVKDNGCGIHPEDLHHIFKRFYRSRFSQDKQGIGLGLPLAKTIVEAHSGTIEVDSELGKGTTFTMNFLIPTKL